MTQKDKQLLLVDLSARLPYGVKVLADIDKIFDGGCIGILNMIEPYVGTKYPELKGQYLLYEKGSLAPLTVEEVRPYLRPMSSMTEDEEREFEETLQYTQYTLESYDWLNEHHFDYRIDPSTGKTLIEMGLALEAPEGMYKIE